LSRLNSTIALVANHIGRETGEIAVLKDIRGVLAAIRSEPTGNTDRAWLV
jgi:hypothetical protein